MTWPRTSWTSPPVHSATRPPSHWRVYKALVGVVAAAILGALEPASLREHAGCLVRHICDPPRKRQPQMRILARAIGP